MTPLAHAVRFAMRCGITRPADLARELECTQSAIYRAMKQLDGADRTVTETDQAVTSDRTELTARSEIDPAVTKSDRTVTEAPRAPARIETPSGLLSSEEKILKTPCRSPKGPTPSDALIAYEAYNATALRCGLRQASKLTPDRQRKIIARLKDYGLDGWTQALANIERSSFLTGKNDREWRANLEFLLQASSFAKVHDGAYGNGRHAEVRTSTPIKWAPPTPEEMRAMNA